MRLLMGIGLLPPAAQVAIVVACFFVGIAIGSRRR